MSDERQQFIAFLQHAVKRVDCIQGLDNELAVLSALNGLRGFLEGGIDGLTITEPLTNP